VCDSIDVDDAAGFPAAVSSPAVDERE